MNYKTADKHVSNCQWEKKIYVNFIIEGQN